MSLSFSSGSGNSMTKSITALHLRFEPLLPESVLIALAVLCIALLVPAFIKSRQAAACRLLCALVFFLALLNPVLLEEERKAVPDVAALVVDDSVSQSFGARAQRRDEARAHLQSALTGLADLELRVVRAPPGGANNDTALFGALDQALADVPLQRRAGAIFLTDGQVHDIPDAAASSRSYGPVHVLLTGDRNEKDRRLVLTQAPAYGIVGQTVTLRYKIEDTGNIGESLAGVSINTQGAPPQSVFVPPGEEQTLEVSIDHPGQNIVALSAAAVPGEITEANNKAALVINGVRERLRVLLVSGKPHAGGRTWRDLLTSDPGVDLVHFTILREPEKLDLTPQKELSLIAFPFRELFEVKLYDFDLVIFDRYQLNRILPDFYFDNIARYVRDGGAFLEASGPAYATRDSIYDTALRLILPAAPDGAVIHKRFVPQVTDLGQNHPVTRLLPGANADAKTAADWGPWLRQVPVKAAQGDVLMTGADDRPLLILQRAGQGRVAQIASDQIWLWSRGYEGGGPHRELLRRLIHWLMKEPELDERALDVTVNGREISLRLTALRGERQDVVMTEPDGQSSTLSLQKAEGGALEARVTADQLGVYSFAAADGQRRFAIVGAVNPPELQDVLATAARFSALARQSGGGILWLAETAKPDVRRVGKNGTAAGRGWIGLRQNHDYNVTSVQSAPLLPAWLWLLAFASVLLLTWWREGRQV